MIAARNQGEAKSRDLRLLLFTLVKLYDTIVVMERTYIKDTASKIGQEVEIWGWVISRRDHGKLIFCDIKDITGFCQAVFYLKNGDLSHAQDLRDWFVVRVKGIVNKRPENMINDKIPTGKIEISVKELEIINKSDTPPFDLIGQGIDISEELRLKYRYLDLRRDRMQKNIKKRVETQLFIRNYLSHEGFAEIETPILSKSTPEGARDFLVPSRLHKGKFYALPQAPQQYKQLLMLAGFEKYFQFAKCFRDEDLRGDRQFEFLQLDMEMSFVKREDVMTINERLLIEIVKNLYPQKIIQEIPFPKITYKEAMEKYGIDRPDIRRDKNNPDLLAFCWVIDFPFFEKTDSGTWTFTHNPFSRPVDKHMDDLLKKQNIDKILTTQYDIVLNGWEIGGGSIRNHQPDALKAVFEIIGFNKEKIKENFGHMLEALNFGAPPHGGIAWGFDRLLCLLNNELNIREVIPFPTDGAGKTSVMNSPSKVEKSQLDELGIYVKNNKEKSK